MTATMNYFPTTVIDNFFVEPHKVVDMTRQDNIVWNPATDGSWPGLRSQMVHEINSEFFVESSFIALYWGQTLLTGGAVQRDEP